ncbi:MAG: type IX secretion system outer membrane channel protein PorV [Bacteroidetes bacterium]|nr:type IX secretion system outer membrane channel protein PorV [Rhodothermia bacterium]MCS7154439.1 type IX secretion system outer membrane channel protein PorV [Bacteroidota bacterium]MCX7906812.1 type IX secretion system outer membrane channel protein PorV [Bacteroidota bacterium]MDW8136909.1 type IX secretion system outer membrane channel protein PorV [Bacteroidota bacterium]MDW8285221.1 type IX secretion system outer membrane channel protein PorV [Bacteroidota bacterium]
MCPIRYTLSLLVLVGLLRPLRAQPGMAAVPFLQIEPDSRAAGMGNTGVAVADNVAAIFWNPAGLAFQQGVEASITHAQWLPQFKTDLFYDYLVGKFRLPNWGTFGAHVTFLNLGEHEYRDADNNFLGTFRSYDLAVGLSYGALLSPSLGLGTGLRFIYSNLTPGIMVQGQEAKAGTTVAADLGLLYRSPSIRLGSGSGRLSLGLNLANLGPAIQYSDNAQADPLPTNLRLGWALSWSFDPEGRNMLTLANDFNKMLVRRDTSGRADPFYKALFTSWGPIQTPGGRLALWQQFTVGLGLEYWYNRLLAVRTGYFYEDKNNGNRRFVTFGAGIRYNIFGVDFSYLYTLEEQHPLANTMRFSLLLDLSRR